MKTLRICGYPVFCYETISPLFLNKSSLEKVKLVDVIREPIDNLVGLVDQIFPALIKVKELIFSLDFLSPKVVAILSHEFAYSTGKIACPNVMWPISNHEDRQIVSTRCTKHIRKTNYFSVVLRTLYKMSKSLKMLFLDVAAVRVISGKRKRNCGCSNCCLDYFVKFNTFNGSF